MNFNFSSFLSSSLKILNIANKALPLIKEVNPTFKNVKNKLESIKLKDRLKMVDKPSIINNQEKKVITNNNSLTFFR